MSRSPLLVACAACAAVVGSAAAPADQRIPVRAVVDAALQSDSLPVEDPFPIRRLRATEAQLPDVRGQLDAGPLVRLPREEFESRVQAAGRVAAAAKNLPRIAEARYKAALIDGDLIGTAELDLANGSATPHFLPLDPLRLALGPASWSDGHAAVVGIPPGAATAGVWVDRPRNATLKFGWSLAGVAEPGERRFEFRVPPAPAAVLEVELPAGQVPAVSSADALLTGPFPAGAVLRAKWLVRFGGRSRLDLAVRPAGNPGVTAAASLVARYELAPGQLACAFEYDLRPAKGTVGEWEFAVDPGLRVTDVVVNNRAGWTIDPPNPDVARRLKVTLRQPGAGGKILVSAVAPFPAPGAPALPGIRPLGAVLDDEKVEVSLAPGTRVESWNAGDYRLTDSQTLSDQTRVLTLNGTLLPPGADRPFRRLPGVRVAAAEADFVTSERVSWRFEADRAAATVRVALRVRRGPLFRFALRPADGFTFGGVTSVPEDLITNASATGGVVAVEFARPLTAGQATELTFEFRGRSLVPGPQRLPFPAFVPVGAAERVGVLGLFPGAGWAVELRPGVGTARAGWLDPFDPVPPAGAAAAFRYAATDPDGWAELNPALAEFGAESAVRVTASPPGRTAATTLRLRVGVGSLPVILATDDPAATGRTWRVAAGANAVASAVAVPAGVLAAPIGPPTLVLPPRLWVVRFARPVTGELTLETSASIPATGDAEQLARVTVIGATPSEAPAPEVKPNPPPVPAREWAFSGVYLVTGVASRSSVTAVFGGTITSADGHSLPVGVPAGAEVFAATVAGRWVEPGALRVSSGVVNLPIPAQSAVRFEVRYRLRTDPGGVATRVRSPEPTLPAPAEVRRYWVFGADVLPGWPVRAWDRATAADLPTLAGEPPAGGDAVVSRSPVDEVRVAGTRTADAAGWCIAALLASLAWAGGRRRHPLCALLAALGLLAVGAALLLGPPWWQRAALIPLVVGLGAAAGMVIVRGHRSRLPAAVALVVCVCALTRSTTVAQPANPATVVILPADSDGRETVVTPKTVLDKLAAAARPATPGVTITSAEYAATVEESTGRVVAKFTAYAADAEPIATLPLADARLERVTVNGTLAHPTSPRPGVYAVALPGPGWHKIEVRFAASVGGIGTERELRFGVPDGPAAKVTAELPGGVKQAQVVGRVGRQTVSAGDRVRLEADAGAVKAVAVRWRDGAGGAAAVKVREACVWDVSESGAELTACYLVTVAQGTVGTLRFDIPAELDPLALAVRPLDVGGSAAVRDWNLGPPQGLFRPLRIDLQGPTGGQMLVAITLAPRQAVTRQPVLRFPKVVGASASAEPDAAYGLRAKGVAVEGSTQAGVIDFSPDALTRDRDFAKVAELRLDPSVPVRVFRPVAAGVAELRPTLRPTAELPGVTLDTTWHLGATRSDATGTVRWGGKDAQTVIDFALPGVKVAEVRGADVAGWAQPGGRVQVWLRRAAKEGELTWAGTATAPASPFDAVTPRVADSRLVADTVRLRPAEGFAAAVERSRGWASAATAADPLTFRTNNLAAPPVRVVVTTTRPTLRPDELGWFGPSAKSPPPPVRTPPVPTPPAPPVAPAEPPPEPVAWVWPVSAAAGWCVAVLVLAVLVVRFPRSTWPEQFALVTGLFGAAVLGGWWVGLLAWAVARVVWLCQVVFRPPAEISAG